MLNGHGMILIRGLDLNLVAGLEGITFQLCGLVYVQPDFVPGLIMHRIKLTLNL
jgi:hypothetical protein